MATTMFRCACRTLSFGGRISALKQSRISSVIPLRFYADSASKIPEDLKYTPSHEWIRMDGEVATLGITDHAQTSLGDVVFCELPEVGGEAVKDNVLCVIESVKAVGDILAPLSGEVTAINDELEGAPEKINQDPYGEGWLVKLKISDPNEVSDLIGPDQYLELVEKDS